MAGKYLAPRKNTPGCRPKGGNPIRDKRRKIITIALAVLFFLLALGLTVYPIFSSRYNEAHQSQIHTEYRDAVQALPDTAIPEARVKAQAYNEELWSSIVQYGSYYCFEEDCDAPVAIRELLDKGLYTAPVNDYFKQGEYERVIHNIIHPTTRRTSKRLPMPENVRKGFRRYSCAVFTGAIILGLTVPAYAANDPLTVVNNLSTFIFGLIRAVGLILLGWGIVQVGLSLQSHDPSQRSNGFLTLAGGIVITFAKEILDLIIA